MILWLLLGYAALSSSSSSSAGVAASNWRPGQPLLPTGPKKAGEIDGISDGAYGGEGVGYITTPDGHRYVIQQAVKR